MQAERTFISINYEASRMVSQCHHNYLLHFLSVSLTNFFNLLPGPIILSFKTLMRQLKILQYSFL
jgi:hypothetical protein